MADWHVNLGMYYDKKASRTHTETHTHTHAQRDARGSMQFQWTTANQLVVTSPVAKKYSLEQLVGTCAL